MPNIILEKTMKDGSVARLSTSSEAQAAELLKDKRYKRVGEEPEQKAAKPAKTDEQKAAKPGGDK